MTKICIIQGHPTGGESHFCHALARAYEEGAAEGGHEPKTINVADLDFPILRSKLEWDTGPAPPSIVEAQERIQWAQHLVIVHPLWIGSVPALLKGFLEQALRPGFAMTMSDNGSWTKLLSGRSVRVVVTMGMPALIYRWYFGAHGLKSLTQNLALVGISPARSTLIGRIEAMSGAKRRKWLDRLRAFGSRAA